MKHLKTALLNHAATALVMDEGMQPQRETGGYVVTGAYIKETTAPILIQAVMHNFNSKKVRSK